jgi:hypothetical protein
MKHFSIESWIDFARQVEGKESRIEMQRHLEGGCSECLKTFEIWRHIVDFKKREDINKPPDYAVQGVNAAFALRKVDPFPAGIFEFATLLFDSALQPVAAGVRGSAPSARQLLYRSGSFCIDMRMQPTPGSEAVVLMGQLLNSAQPEHGMRDIPVSLLCQGDTLSRKKTNDVGEFDFGLATLQHLQLAFGIEGTRTIVVPVPDAPAGTGVM